MRRQRAACASNSEKNFGALSGLVWRAARRQSAGGTRLYRRTDVAPLAIRSTFPETALIGPLVALQAGEKRLEVSPGQRGEGPVPLHLREPLRIAEPAIGPGPFQELQAAPRVARLEARLPSRFRRLHRPSVS